MHTLLLVLNFLSCLILLMSVIPFIRNDYWAFRVFEYPRLQKLIASVLLFSGLLLLQSMGSVTSYIVPGCLLLNVAYLSFQIFPFISIAPTQVQHAVKKVAGQTLTILTANVYQYNRRGDEYLMNIHAADPDVILLLETDSWWEQKTASLKEKYPYSVKIPLENTYGMLLYSRYRIKSYSICFLVEKDIPSIHAVVQLPCGQPIQLYCVHPTPPVPNENPRSTERDKELLLVAKMAKENKLPVIVMGDLNDVAWSYTTSLFCKISGLLDPRRGRGFYNTFHAQYPFLRFPLDHIFCSAHFKLIHMSRLPASGSDHFPIYAQLQYEKQAVLEQEEPVAEQEDIDTANEKIAKETGS